MGTYISRSDVEDVYGVDNVADWADQDNDGDATAILNRINAQIAVAESYVEARFRKGRYKVPLSISDGEEFVHYIMAVKAGNFLYKSISATSDATDEPGDVLSDLDKMAEKWLDGIVSGRIKLDAVLNEVKPGPTAPFVVF